MRKAMIARLTAVILAAATIFTSMSMSVFAEEVDFSMESSVSESNENQFLTIQDSTDPKEDLTFADLQSELGLTSKDDFSKMRR